MAVGIFALLKQLHIMAITVKVSRQFADAPVTTIMEVAADE
jgi:hypothetical protein